MKKIYKDFYLLFLLFSASGIAYGQTEVAFTEASVTVLENSATYEVGVYVTDEDVTTSTTVDVVLSAGESSRVGDFTTQSLEFVPAESDTITISITITDNSDTDGLESLTFDLSNVAGGNSAVLGSQSSFVLTIIDDDLFTSALVLNEINADPASGTDGDANGDGTRDATDDEFVEIVNTSDSVVNLDGYTLYDMYSSITSRHVFPDASSVEAGGAIVVFGGGSPSGDFGNSVVQTASSGSIAATNTEDGFILLDSLGRTIFIVEYGDDAGDDQSITRDPDITGDFAKHSEATDADGALFSPGTKIDGSYFVEVETTSVQFASSSATVSEADSIYTIEITIVGADASNATSVEVVLTDGDSLDIGSYSTQTVTFPADSSSNQIITITLTDDSDIEGEEVLTFTLQNVSGGSSAALGTQSTFELTITDNDYEATALVINEFLPYPSSTSITEDNEVDANGDGSLSGTGDEFIELVNSGETDLDISGWKLSDGTERHVFPDSTIVEAGGAIVVFATDATGIFGNSVVQTATTGNLGLSNSGDEFYVLDADDDIRLSASYSESEVSVGVSISRNPDITGDMASHPENSTVLNNGGGSATISPGTKVDGSFFIEVETTTVQFASSSATVSEADSIYTMEIAIIGADASNATTVEVALTDGDSLDIGNYTTQTVTFPADSSSNQVITITLTDDSDIEGEEVLTFTLQNVSGGSSAELGTQSTFELTITDNDYEATALVINEFLPYPSSTSITEDNEVDSNGDGTLDGYDDEFIELVNSGETDLDISGWKLSDGTERHVFPDSTIVPAGGAIVVFGDDATGIFGNSVVQTATTGNLGLSNSGDEFYVLDADDNVRLSASYSGDDVSVGVSISRNPDITGDMASHPENSEVINNGGGSATISPGTKVDGTFFIEVETTTVQFVSSSATVSESDSVYTIEIAILGADATNATSVEIALTDGDSLDIGSYSTQTVTFPADSSSNQVITITLTDDSDIEGEEVLTFTLQNASGGSSATLGTQSTFELTITDNDYEATALVINEFLPYPSSTSITEDNEVDANGDGSLSGTGDEFIELVNSGETDLDISGWKLSDGTERHVFPDSTIVEAGGAIVVFATDATGIFGNSVVQTATTGNLGLSNSGDEFYVLDADDNVRLSASYLESEVSVGVSISRNPDITGDMGDHPENSTVLNNGGGSATISPGTKVDGTYFIEIETTIVQFASSGVTVSEEDSVYTLEISILGADASNATSVEIALTDGDAADIDNYTTQTVTFPADSSSNQVITITLTDDSDIEGEEVLTFTLQNVSGGNSAELGSQSTFELTITDNDFAESTLVVNEVMVYPSISSLTDDHEVDTNGDGSLHGTEDEFVELVNSGTEDMDISGWSIWDSDEARHTFETGTSLSAGSAIVVFAGGDPTGEFGGAQVVVSSTGSFSFQNSGDKIILKDSDGETRFSYTYSATSIGVSFTRNPDITGEAFTLHPALDGIYTSPGTMVDGTPFAVDSSTRVQFYASIGGAFENDESGYELFVEISDEDATTATTADVVLVTEGGDADFNYTTQTVTFPAGSSDMQSVIITLNDDAELEGDELFTFELQNISGGQNAKSGSNSTFEFMVMDDDVPLIFNEVHADPASGDDGDANNDGVRDASYDEFIEVINQSTEQIDISGWEYYDSEELRHIFADETVLDPGRAVVVFGGGIPTGLFGGSSTQVASEGSGVSLTNTGETLKIYDTSGSLMGGTTYGSSADNGQSITRSPDITGQYTIHTEAMEGVLYSPGTAIDGTFFIDLVTGTESEEDLTSIPVVYPNPTSDQLTVELSSTLKNFTFSLFDLNGKQVLRQDCQNTNEISLDLSGVEQGLYLYRIDIESQSKTHQGKLIIK